MLFLLAKCILVSPGLAKLYFVGRKNANTDFYCNLKLKKNHEFRSIWFYLIIVQVYIVYTV